MSKIDEIVRSVDPNAINNYTHLDNWTLDDVEYCMKTYAEWYAKKCLEIAANNALIKKTFTLGFDDSSSYVVTETEENNYLMTVNKDSITNITLPEHE